jgi:hypothetical protein
MAISPNQLNEEFKKEVNNLEKVIDGLLDKKTLNFGGTITLSAPKGMTYNHFEALKSRYINAGWKELNWDSFYDQRDQYDYATIIFKS